MTDEDLTAGSADGAAGQSDDSTGQSNDATGQSNDATGQSDDSTDPPNGDEGLTYAEAGVDVAASEAATAALLETVGGGVGENEAFAGHLPIGDRVLGVATDGVGTKLLVAAALGEYTTIGIDLLAMNANDLVAAGIDPAAFVDYLAVEEPDEDRAAQLGVGLREGADRANVELLGGETAVMPDIIRGYDLAGTCVGLAPKEAVFDGTARPGDALVGWPSSGIHSNGLTLAREAATRDGSYTDPCPFDGYETIGAALLEPTRIYTDLLEPMRAHDVRAAAHVTGGGWRNLTRMGTHRYEITDPCPVQPVFEYVQRVGGVSEAEMHRTFNMGTGFVAACPAEPADDLAEATDGRVIGRVATDEASEDGTISIRGLTLE